MWGHPGHDRLTETRHHREGHRPDGRASPLGGIPRLPRPCLRGVKPWIQVHVILDNVSSHKSAEVNEWLRNNANWTFHFTPTSPSWMNVVEGFFSKLSRQRLKHAIFNSLDECVAAFEGYIEHHNANDARPFRWSRKPEDLVEGWKRGHRKLQESAS